MGHICAFHVAQRALRNPQDTSVTLICDIDDQEAIAAAKQLGGSFLSRPTAMLRVGRLTPLLQAWATGIHLPPGAQFSPCVLDGGAAGRVRISASDRRIQVADTTEKPDLTLCDVALAELIFGTVPQQIRSLGLADDSVLHFVVPLAFNISECYAL